MRSSVRAGIPEAEIQALVDSHWEAAAAEIEAGNCERLAAKHKTE
ncbi:hypothetical protein [Nitrobacter sp. JJSN]